MCLVIYSYMTRVLHRAVTGVTYTAKRKWGRLLHDAIPVSPSYIGSLRSRTMFDLLNI